MFTFGEFLDSCTSIIVFLILLYKFHAGTKYFKTKTTSNIQTMIVITIGNQYCVKISNTVTPNKLSNFIHKLYYKTK